MNQNNQEFPLEGYCEVTPGAIDGLFEETENDIFGGLEEIIKDARASELNSRVDDTFIDMFMKDLGQSGLQTVDSATGGSANKAKRQRENEATVNLIADLFSEDDQGDKITPIIKKARIEYQPGRTNEEELEATLAERSSNVGSSSMHQLQALQHSATLSQGSNFRAVLDHASSGYIEGALEQFYATAYRRFEMAPPSSASTSATINPPCVGHPENLISTEKLVVSKNDISDLLRKQLQRGKDLGNQNFVEALANSMLQQKQFSCLCPSCGTFFYNSRTFNSHLVKDGSKFRCLYGCAQLFSRLDILKRHMKMHHGRGAESYQTRTKAFRCTVPGCGDEFFTTKGLFRHTRMTHGSGIAPCQYCRVVFGSQAEMNAHLLSVHGVKEGEPLPFACDSEGCTVRCRTEGGLRQHKRRVHNISDPSSG